MNFKEYFKNKDEIIKDHQIKDKVILNEMARYIDILKLESDPIFNSKITNKDKFIKKIDDFDLYVKNMDDYKIFKLANKEGIVLAYIQTKKHHKIDNRETLTIEVSRRDEKLKGYGYGMKLYKYILEKYCILSDSQNTPDSINVWMSLLYDNDLENGIYDFKAKEVILRNIDIKPSDIGAIWKKFDWVDDELINPVTKKPLNSTEKYIGLHYRVFVYKK